MFPTISSSQAQQLAAEQLAGFPEAVKASYLAYVDSGELDCLDTVILGVIEFYLATPPARPLADMPGSTRLMEDLGVDSLTMVDTMFMAESLFAMKLTDEELARVTTLDELRGHFRKHLALDLEPAA